MSAKRLSITDRGEETFAEHLSAKERSDLGAFFTPRAVVDRALDAVSRFIPDRPFTIVDPACGAGAFLFACAERWPKARLVGFELHPVSAQKCRERVPTATVVEGDALKLDLDAVLGGGDRFELWVGNPPYNGTSALLRDKPAYERVRAWLPATLAKGQSLRDDYAFFLLLAARRLATRRGALSFITSASLLDAFIYAPLREHLLQTLTLRQVDELGAKVFANAQVSTCLTAWTSPRTSDELPSGIEPRAPEWRLKPIDRAADALHQRWSERGEPLDVLVPLSLPGLKTRFDELLVDDDRERLLQRLKAFVTCGDVEAFGTKWQIDEALWPKLHALRETVDGAEVSSDGVLPFIRYRGPNERGPTAWCYVDRRLIPRGDHRLQGGWNPHLQNVKLVFNLRELPLAAHLIDEPGCVTAYRHSRFAPALVPVRALEGSLRGDDGGGRLVPNLSERGRALGTPKQVFAKVAAFVMSPEVQRVWAPAFGTSRVLPVPLDALTRRSRSGGAGPTRGR